MSGTERLTRRQRLALAALLASPTVRRAAETAGVGESTLRRWLSQASFQEEYRRAAREVHSEAVSVVLSAQTEVVSTVLRIMREGNSDGSLRAAIKLLELGHKVSEDDLDQRVSRLESIADRGPLGEQGP